MPHRERTTRLAIIGAGDLNTGQSALTLAVGVTIAFPGPTRSAIPAVIQDNAKKYAKKTAISYKKKGVYLSLTYEEFYERVLMLARGLRKFGMTPGDKVAIFSENRLGWAISDFGIQCAGGITVPKTRGSGCVFPSWVPHSVDEITSGTRYSLAAWAKGAYFL